MVKSKDESYFVSNQVLESYSSNYKSYLETPFKLRRLITPRNMWSKMFSYSSTYRIGVVMFFVNRETKDKLRPIL